MGSLSRVPEVDKAQKAQRLKLRGMTALSLPSLNLPLAFRGIWGHRPRCWRREEVVFIIAPGG